MLSLKAQRRRGDSELVVGSGHVDGPAELFPLRLVVDLLDGHLVLLAPGHRDPGVEVVQLGGSQGDRLVLLLVHGLGINKFVNSRVRVTLINKQPI